MSAKINILSVGNLHGDASDYKNNRNDNNNNNKKKKKKKKKKNVTSLTRRKFISFVVLAVDSV